MAPREFTFVNGCSNMMHLQHTLKNIHEAAEIFPLEANGGRKTIRVPRTPQSYEKYWLLDSDRNNTLKFVSTDDMGDNQQVTVTKEGDVFDLKFMGRPKSDWQIFLNWFKFWKHKDSGNDDGSTRQENAGAGSERV